MIVRLAKSPQATTVNDVDQQGAARYCTSSADCFPGESCNSGDSGTATNECYGGPCSTDADCGTCQTCSTGGTCALPDPSGACMMSALAF